MRLVHGRFEPNPLRLLLANSVPETTGLLHPLCHAEGSSLLTYGTHNGRIGPPLSSFS